MLFICEQYAIDYKIMFNSKKSKFMCFQKQLDMATNYNNCISMKDGSSMEHVKKCVHLGNSDISLKCIDGIVCLIYLSVQIVYYMIFQMSIVTLYLNCITHIV